MGKLDNFFIGETKNVVLGNVCMWFDEGSFIKGDIFSVESNKSYKEQNAEPVKLLEEKLESNVSDDNTKKWSELNSLEDFPYPNFLLPNSSHYCCAFGLTGTDVHYLCVKENGILYSISEPIESASERIKPLDEKTSIWFLLTAQSEKRLQGNKSIQVDI